jgi:hypothetical protein
MQPKGVKGLEEVKEIKEVEEFKAAEGCQEFKGIKETKHTVLFKRRRASGIQIPSSKSQSDGESRQR